ncbi:MAG TPA: amino acid ABC transporter permease, partial [Paenirhodobacter sp.]
MIGKISPTAPFVRKHMLPAEPPPARASGAPKWLRENLFSSWQNAVLTVVGMLILYLLLSHFAPWFIHGVWHA